LVNEEGGEKTNREPPGACENESLLVVNSAITWRKKKTIKKDLGTLGSVRIPRERGEAQPEKRSPH